MNQNVAIIEVRGGTGGDEAALFATELLRMYTRYAERQEWKLVLVSSNRNDLGGFKEKFLNTASDRFQNVKNWHVKTSFVLK